MLYLVHKFTMKKFLLVIGLVAGGMVEFCFADNPARISLSETSFSFFRTTGIAGVSPPTASNFSISSGIVKCFGIYVSSPGNNSELRFYDNRLAGDTSNQIGVAIRTDSRGFIEFPIETERGLVFTSTATVTGVWNQPSFNLYYRRIR